ISDRVKAIPDHRVGKQFDLGISEATAGVSLIPGHPAVDEFPIAVWERFRAQVLAKKGAHLLRYGSNRGDADLRKAIATYLYDFRGAHCHPDQIIIVAGMQQAMLMSAMTVLNPGEAAWVEDRGYQQARRAFIFAGTISKILYPSLRLGYIVVPEQLVDSMAKVRSVMDQHSPTIDQAILARFITEGFFLSHIKRMRKIYSERREFFINEFNKLLSDRFILQIPEAGLHLVAWLRHEADFAKVARVRAEIGIKPVALSFFCIAAK